MEAGLASKNDKIKILSMGEVKRPLKVEADAFSKKAKEVIEAAGGSVVTA